MPDQDEEPETLETVINPPSEGTVDVGSTRGLNKQERELLYKRREQEAFWRGVLSTPIGRREIWTLIADISGNGLHAFNPDFGTSPAGFNDPNLQWYRRGQQDFGLNLYHRLMVLAPDEIRLMHLENDARFFPPVEKKPRRRKTDQ